jgi:pyridoxine/pyridoxamine 5'-phosphate oxidase
LAAIAARRDNAPPEDRMPIALTPEMMQAINNAITDRVPCLVGTASADGMPDVSYRGSMMAFDEEHLAFWERVKGESLANIEANPRVVVMYVNRETRANWRLYGEAQVVKDGELRERIMQRVHPFELMQDPERQGFAVLIRIDRVRSGSQTIMSRDV